ncbi:pectate lyase [Actinoplanes sp. NEAU-A12]|uniref:pectate lyase n=1 Tax=Actinoplanes sandaracinus TaxID=3045177 RepID=A0ABT6WLU3_9ACTN|nr:pectate lyase [Actinoplanes sandaracinus]MDI6100683.1 pectate lyase [Actinoplanes sandaracinus]
MPSATPSRRRRRLVVGLGAAGAAGAVTALVAILVPSASAGTQFSDDFENGAGNWTKSGGDWSLVSDGSKVYKQAKTESELARVFAGETSWTNYSVEAKVKALDLGSGLAGVAARASGSSTMYRLALTSAGKAELQAVKGSAITTIGSAPVSNPAAWHTLKVDVSGSTITGYVDGAKVASGAGALPGTGRIGLVTSYAAAEFDDVSVNPLGAGPATSAPAATPTATKPATASPTATKTATASPTATKTAGATPTATKTAAPAPTAAPAAPSVAWPKATVDKPVTATIPVSGTVDGGNARYFGSGALGGDGQDEGQDPLFKLADGAVLKNVILGAPAADGIHCSGSCTLINVWWENVGEDAATFKGGASATYTVDGGGAKGADDKVFQHNGGGTLTIKNFQVSDFGKLYRSCGNCSTQHKRAVVVQNVVVTAPVGSLVGINQNFGDTATISKVTVVGKKSLDICVKFTGNNTGKEPTKIGAGPDGTFCKYTESDITFK